LNNRRVRPQRVNKGDLVLRKAKVSDQGRTRGKLASNGEGLYRIIPSTMVLILWL
ncbi:hypothetical protein BHM03_00051358, partial [Ensete ventricosum]